MNGFHITAIAVFILFASTAQAVAADGNPARGQRVFAACAGCHSLEPGRNMTGPSLADLWNRKAGGLQSFSRYSDALKSANIVWDDETLDEWVEDPQHLVPGNTMTFEGIKDAHPRANLLTFLKQATQKGGSETAQQNAPGGGTMGGGMGGGHVPNLKELDDDNRVRSIAHCNDTYIVTTADGKTHKYWERNLRLKTDTSDDGPERNAPALVGAGMMGDRADVIFAAPAEISPFIKATCE